MVGRRTNHPVGEVADRAAESWADAVAAVLGVETGFTWLLAGVLF